MEDSYLCVINFACAEQRMQRVISGNQEAGEVDQEFPANVEKDQEEV